jgi:molecular chaperone GrpE
MTKSPESGDLDPTILRASAGDGQGPGPGEVPASGGSSQASEASPGGDDGDDLALEVEVEPPEPTPDQRIAELEAKQKETYDRYLRSVAELDNFRKRARKDMEDARVDAQSRVLREMLPVIDNLERALAAAGGAEASNGHSIVEGVRLVLRQFAQALERCGVTLVSAHGEPFDPTQHEAVSQVETDQAPAGTVVDVLQTGYRIGERLLRPALVVVAKAPPALEPEGDDGDRHGANGRDGDSASAGPNGRDPEAA